jgi:starch synthase (maltosyl-transferring)
MLKHILIEAVTPSVDGGRYPTKRVVGDICVVEADIFRDGQALLRAVVKYKRKGALRFDEAPMREVENDRWQGSFLLAENTQYLLTVEAWTDRFGSWLSDFSKKVEAGKDVDVDLRQGLSLIEAVHRRADEDNKKILTTYLDRIRVSAEEPDIALEVLREGALGELMTLLDEREDAAQFEPLLTVVAHRKKARVSAWYQMFPRSQGTEPGKPATLREAERRLPEIRDLGFDVLYLAPVHPIGVTNRKGKNGAVDAGPGDPGCPWAIGNADGGHTAIEPALGTLDDFDHFVAAADKLGLDVALDFAVQCSPDHPWVREHPEWFVHRPDGSIRHAENPPFEYQDIYPLDFDTPDQVGLYTELYRVLLFWIDRGVRMFRVDNPHSKPVSFWEWLIAKVQAAHPNIVFLSEAFTRPKMMKALAKAGFTQSYTYFMWRNDKKELTEYLTELARPDMHDYFWPNFFVNTPDHIPPVLQKGGRPAFKMRLVLAATMSPSFGMYSGYELCEHEAIENTDEYKDSEKFEIRVRDWQRPGNINDYVARLNAIRRNNPAIEDVSNIKFLATDSEHILCYVKATPDKSNVVLVAVNLDPTRAHQCTVEVPPEEVGAAPETSYEVEDLLTGARYTWSRSNYVRLDPEVEPAHVFRVEVEKGA